MVVFLNFFDEFAKKFGGFLSKSDECFGDGLSFAEKSVKIMHFKD